MSDDRPHWLVRTSWAMEMRRGRWSLPSRGVLGDLMLYGRPLVANAWSLLLQTLVREPALRRRAQHLGQRPRLMGVGPYIMGEGHLEIGDDLELGPECNMTVGIARDRDALLHIGDHVRIGLRNTICASKHIHIGDYVRTSSYVGIYDTDMHAHDALARRVDGGPVPNAPVVIEDDAWLGLGAVVLKGVTIGRGAIVGAGAVVAHDVAPFTIVAGNPARPVGEAPRS